MRIDVGADGAAIVALDDTLVAGARTRLRPDANLRGCTIDWHCNTEGDDALHRHLPACRG